MIGNKMIGPILQFQDLQRVSGYTRAADVERWAKENGIAVKRARDGVWTTLSALEQALGLHAANQGTYDPDAVI